MEYYGNDGATMGLSEAHPITLRVRFVGEERPLCLGTVTAIEAWAISARVSVGMKYGRQLLFNDGRRQHWLAVSDEFASEVRESHQPESTMDIAARFIGGIGEGPSSSWVFIVP